MWLTVLYPSPPPRLFQLLAFFLFILLSFLWGGGSAQAKPFFFRISHQA